MTEPRVDGEDGAHDRVPAGETSAPGAGEFQDVDAGLVTPGDLGSASRSCLAIIVVLIVILLLLCVFFVGQQVS